MNNLSTPLRSGGVGLLYSRAVRYLPTGYSQCRKTNSKLIRLHFHRTVLKRRFKGSQHFYEILLLPI